MKAARSVLLTSLAAVVSGLVCETPTQSGYQCKASIGGLSVHWVLGTDKTYIDYMVDAVSSFGWLGVAWNAQSSFMIGSTSVIGTSDTTVQAYDLTAKVASTVAATASSPAWLSNTQLGIVSGRKIMRFRRTALTGEVFTTETLLFAFHSTSRSLAQHTNRDTFLVDWRHAISPSAGITAHCSAVYTTRTCATCANSCGQEIETLIAASNTPANAMSQIATRYPATCGRCSVNQLCFTDDWNTAACDAQNNCGTCGSRIDWVLANGGTAAPLATRTVAIEFPTQCGKCRLPLAMTTACYAVRAASACSNGQCATCEARITFLNENRVSDAHSAMNTVGLEFPTECGVCSTVTTGVPVACAADWEKPACSSSCMRCGQWTTQSLGTGLSASEAAMQTAISFPNNCLGCTSVPGITISCYSDWNTMVCDQANQCSTCGSRIMSEISSQGRTASEAIIAVTDAFPTGCPRCDPPTGVTAICLSQWDSNSCNSQGQCATCGARIMFVINDLGRTVPAAMLQIATEFPSDCGLCGVSANCINIWNTPCSSTGCPSPTQTCGAILTSFISQNVYSSVALAETALARQHASCESCANPATTPVPSPTDGLPSDAGSGNAMRGSTLIFEDNFDSATVDETKWNFELGRGPDNDGWGNQELQVYTREAVTQSGGKLIITATKTNGVINSGRINTLRKVEILYGYVEVRAKLPRAVRGTWPAIWMLPSDYKFGIWPASGEIDIMENVGWQPSISHATIHNGARSGGAGETHCVLAMDAIFNPKCFSEAPTADLHNEFHTYSVLWSPTSITMYLDNNAYATFTRPDPFTSNTWPYTEPFHLLINFAYGGTLGGARGTDETQFPLTFEIEYVRMYQHHPVGTTPQCVSVWMNSQTCTGTLCDRCGQLVESNIQVRRYAVGRAQYETGVSNPIGCGKCSVGELCNAQSTNNACTPQNVCATCESRIDTSFASGVATAPAVVGELYPTSCGQCNLPYEITAACYAQWNINVCDQGICQTCGTRVSSLQRTNNWYSLIAMDVVGHTYSACSACTTVLAGAPTACAAFWTTSSCSQGGCATCGARIQALVTAGTAISEASMQTAISFPNQCTGCSSVVGVSSACLNVWTTSACTAGQTCTDSCGSRIIALIAGGRTAATSMIEVSAGFTACAACAAPPGISELCFRAWNTLACDASGDCNTCGSRIQTLTGAGETPAASMLSIATRFPSQCGKCGVSAQCTLLYDVPSCTGSSCTQPINTCGQVIDNSLSSGSYTVVRTAETAAANRFSNCALCTTDTPVPSPTSGLTGSDTARYSNQIWEDVFTSTTLDTQTWSASVPATSETQSCSLGEVSISGGNLRIRASKSSTVTTGCINTKEKRNWLYGYFEARVKFPPPSTGYSASITLLPEVDRFGPRPQSGEIKIMVGGDRGGIIQSSIQTKAARGTTAFTSCAMTATSLFDPTCFTDLGSTVNIYNDFHNYAVLWQPDSVDVFVDGVGVLRYVRTAGGTSDDWPFSELFHVDFRISFTGDSAAQDQFPYYMDVEHVRVSQIPPTPVPTPQPPVTPPPTPNPTPFPRATPQPTTMPPAPTPLPTDPTTPKPVVVPTGSPVLSGSPAISVPEGFSRIQLTYVLSGVSLSSFVSSITDFNRVMTTQTQSTPTCIKICRVVRNPDTTSNIMWVDEACFDCNEQPITPSPTRATASTRSFIPLQDNAARGIKGYFQTATTSTTSATAVSTAGRAAATSSGGVFEDSSSLTILTVDQPVTESDDDTTVIIIAVTCSIGGAILLGICLYCNICYRSKSQEQEEEEIHQEAAKELESTTTGTFPDETPPPPAPRQ